ncbi:MAG TPA: hypothetical protein VMT78_00535 [Terriglobia bacterium]|nr:hypothetical protein [Terriglobia bacterium]
MNYVRCIQFDLLIALLGIILATPPSLAAQTRDPDLARTRPTRFNASFAGGSGLIQAVSPDTLPSGVIVAGASVMNFDRDPADVDLFEYSFQGAIGVTSRTEFFVRVMPWMRANGAQLEPVKFPAPPLDLFVDAYPTSALRSGPYFMFAQSLPYKTVSPTNMTETGAFSSSTGDNVFGLKVNLRSQDRGDGAGIGVRGFIEVPTETPRYNAPYPEFRQVNGVSGEVNYGGDLLFGRTWKSSEVLANIGYKQTGNPNRGLRVQMVDSSQTAPEKFLIGNPVDVSLDLSNELRISAGWTMPLFHYYKAYWWLVGEFNHTRYVGSHTLTNRLVHPTEISLGIQSNVPWYKAISVGASWQVLLNSAGQGQAQATSLQTGDGRGDINFSELLDNPELTAEVKAFLQDRGATFTKASNKVFSTNNPAFDSWRNIPVDPVIIQSKGHTNILAFITWRIGGRS